MSRTQQAGAERAYSEACLVDGTEDVEQLTRSDVFHVLQAWRRRETLRFLLENDGEATLGDLADHIAAYETEGQVGSTERKRVYVSLYQCHLPKLDDLGIVSFEQARGTVTATETIELLSPYLDASGDKQPLEDWQVAAIGGLVGAAAGVGTQVAVAGGPVVAVAVAVVLGAVFATTGVGHDWGKSILPFRGVFDDVRNGGDGA